MPYRRIVLALIALSVCLVFLALRLYGWQVLAGPDLARLARTQRTYNVHLETARGRILDRHGREMSSGEEAWALVVFPGGIRDREAFAMDLEPLLGIGAPAILKALESNSTPFILSRNLSGDIQAVLSRVDPGSAVAVPVDHRYGSEALARHVVGYVNSSDGRGAAGLEAVYDAFLQGEGATTLTVEVNANLGLIAGLGHTLNTPDQDTNDLILTIDRDIQRIVESIMDRHVAQGAVVVLDPGTGEVLAMASRPQYTQGRLEEYLGASEGPLLNRAVRPFPPGSVFKMVVAAAVLEEGLDTGMYRCDGEIAVDGLAFGCYLKNEGGHGDLDLATAMAESCNVAFIQMASRVGPDILLEYSRRFHLGSPVGLGLPEEVLPSLPPRHDLGPRGLANFAIGQGGLLVTPLDMAKVIAAIANDGVMMEPWIVKEVRSSRGELVYQGERPRGEQVLSVETARSLQVLLERVTTVGTGRRAFVEGPGASGKTGTAETGRRDSEGRRVSHAWFVGYSPMDEPRYVVTVFVEDGMSGAVVAAPVFREILEGIFAVKTPRRL